MHSSALVKNIIIHIILVEKMHCNLLLYLDARIELYLLLFLQHCIVILASNYHFTIYVYTFNYVYSVHLYMLYRRYFTLNIFLVNAHPSREHVDVPLATSIIYSIPHIYNLALFTSQLLLGFTGDLH